ncbi:MAG: shikimate kinase [bacterium]
MPHIILIGFKNIGKTTIGKLLAKKLNIVFYDIDAEVEINYLKNMGEKLNFRQIAQKEGIEFFHKLEGEALKSILEKDEIGIIATGGGSILAKENRNLIKKQTVIYITAPQNVVYKRIISNGIPAFFPKGKNPKDSFLKLWKEREPIYRGLADVIIDNNAEPERVVEEIIEFLNNKK